MTETTGDSAGFEREQEMQRQLLEFRTDRTPQRREWLTQHTSLPSTLYHYTTMAGFQGIISSGTLWASDVRHLNDTSELTYAIDLVERVSLARLAEDDLRWIYDVLHNGYLGLDTFSQFQPVPFVTCFCEDGDLLSQWRGYTTTGSVGYSLGLNLRRLGELPPRMHLRRVIYAPAEQEKAVRDVVEAWAATAQRLVDETSLDVVFPYPALWALHEALSDCLLCFKNPAFAEEHEWRLIKLVHLADELEMARRRREEATDAARRAQWESAGFETQLGQGQPIGWLRRTNAEGLDLKFRAAPHGFVPYLELDLPGALFGLLPIADVVQGPVIDPIAAGRAATMLMQSHGYTLQGPIRPSDVPLR